eukprot:scpid79892/ scgid35031/ 
MPVLCVLLSRTRSIRCPCLYCVHVYCCFLKPAVSDTEHSVFMPVRSYCCFLKSALALAHRPTGWLAGDWTRAGVQYPYPSCSFQADWSPAVLAPSVSNPPSVALTLDADRNLRVSVRQLSAGLHVRPMSIFVLCAAQAPVMSSITFVSPNFMEWIRSNRYLTQPLSDIMHSPGPLLYRLLQTTATILVSFHLFKPALYCSSENHDACLSARPCIVNLRMARPPRAVLRVSDVCLVVCDPVYVCGGEPVPHGAATLRPCL